jgi:hypothetical protein
LLIAGRRLLATADSLRVSSSEYFGNQRHFTFSLIAKFALKREATQILQGSEF